MLDFLLLVGEVAWIYAWAVAAGAWWGNGTAVALPALFLLLVAAVVVSRLVASGRWHMMAGRGLVVVLGIAAAALTVLVQLNLPGRGIRTRLPGTDGWTGQTRVGLYWPAASPR